MKKCKKCNVDLENNASFCHICGAESEVIVETQQEERRDYDDTVIETTVVAETTAVKEPMTRRAKIGICIGILLVLVISITGFLIPRTPDYEEPIKIICAALKSGEWKKIASAYLEGQIADTLQDEEIVRYIYLGNADNNLVKDVTYRIKEVTAANEFDLKNFANMIKYQSGDYNDVNRNVTVQKGYTINIELMVSDEKGDYTKNVEVLIGKTENGWGCIEWTIIDNSDNGNDSDGGYGVNVWDDSNGSDDSISE